MEATIEINRERRRARILAHRQIRRLARAGQYEAARAEYQATLTTYGPNVRLLSDGVALLSHPGDHALRLWSLAELAAVLLTDAKVPAKPLARDWARRALRSVRLDTPVAAAAPALALQVSGDELFVRGFRVGLAGHAQLAKLATALAERPEWDLLELARRLDVHEEWSMRLYHRLRMLARRLERLIASETGLELRFRVTKTTLSAKI